MSRYCGSWIIGGWIVVVSIVLALSARDLLIKDTVVASGAIACLGAMGMMMLRVFGDSSED